MKFVVQFIKMTEKQSAVGRPVKDSVNKSIGVMNLPILVFLSYRKYSCQPSPKFSILFGSGCEYVSLWMNESRGWEDIRRVSYNTF